MVKRKIKIFYYLLTLNTFDKSKFFVYLAAKLYVIFKAFELWYEWYFKLNINDTMRQDYKEKKCLILFFLFLQHLMLYGHLKLDVVVIQFYELSDQMKCQQTKEHACAMNVCAWTLAGHRDTKIKCEVKIKHLVFSVNTKICMKSMSMSMSMFMWWDCFLSIEFNIYCLNM